MYYPYLRAKQFELKALKDFFQECPDENRIVPILEPVNRTSTALLSAVNCFIENRKRFALILNPRLGAFEHSTVPFNFPDENPEQFASIYCIPSFLVENNADDVKLQNLRDDEELQGLHVLRGECVYQAEYRKIWRDADGTLV